MKRLITFVFAAYSLLVLVRSVARGTSARLRARSAATEQPVPLPFVSVIIPAWSDRAALGNCLRSLERVDYPDYEVIVVAGGSDGTYEAACESARHNPRLQVVKQLPLGKNAALNLGLAAARADVLVLLDADSELSPQWLAGLVGALQGDAAASTGNYLPVHETPVSLYGDLAKVHEYQVLNRVILQGSGGIAVRRAALDAIGPFPEERVSSDWDLDARLALRGYQRVFAPGAVIRSQRPATLAEWWRNELRWRRLHLRSLFRLKDGLLADPMPAARHLYPYVTSWAAALATLLALASLFAGSPQLRKPARLGWTGLTSLLLVRELGAVISVIVFQPSSRWLPVIPLTPIMTALTWAACLIASLTRNQAALQFKGVRRDPTAPLR